MSLRPDTMPGAYDQATESEPHAGVPFVTILLDISANLLCVVVLILAISAASQSRQPSAEITFPIVAGEVLAPAGLVGSLRLRTVRDDSVSTIDLLGGHVELKLAGAAPTEVNRILLSEPDFSRALGRMLAPTTGKVLVFVFSQEGYGTLRRSLDDLGASVTEVDVPAALREAGPDGGWSGRFRALFDRQLDAGTFPEQLARIIAGGADGGDGEPEQGSSRPSAAAGETGSIVWTVLQTAWRLILLALSVYAIVRIGRMERRKS